MAGVKAVVADPYHQSGPGTFVAVTKAEAEQAIAQDSEDFGPGIYTGQNYVPSTLTSHLCQCGMATANTPHLCLRWHHRMMKEEAKKDLTAVVRRYVAQGDVTPLVTVDMDSLDTKEYLRQMVLANIPANAFLAIIGHESFLTDLPLYTADGKRLTFAWGEPDGLVGTRTLTVTKSDDPAWVRTFVDKHSIERSPSAMPACCDKPDPRIGKSGRPFCNNCRKYLDKLAKPVEPVGVPKNA